MVASDLKTIGKPSNPIVAQLATMWPSHCLPGCGQQSNPLVAWTKNHRNTIKMVPCRKKHYHCINEKKWPSFWNPDHPSKGKGGKSSSPQKRRLRNAQGVVRHSSALCGPSYCLFFCGTCFVSRNGTELFSRKYIWWKGVWQIIGFFSLLPMPCGRHIYNRMQTLGFSPNCSPECINLLKNQFLRPFRTDAVNRDVPV